MHDKGMAVISIHAPHAGSEQLRRGEVVVPYTDFNPRSPCGERNLERRVTANDDEFQSTLPMRGAKDLGIGRVVLHIISIHAPHAGSESQTKNTESMRDSTYNFANLIKQVL